MTFKQDNPGCDCCFSCDDCASLTFISISLVSDPIECGGGCSGITQGTYIFRSFNQPFDVNGGCGWGVPLGASNCGLDDDPAIFIGGYPDSLGGCGSALGNQVTVAFYPVAGGVRVHVSIRMQYTIGHDGGSPPPAGAKSSLVTYNWWDDFPTCADGAGVTLTFRGFVETVCRSPGTGDFCGLGSARVGVG